MSVQSLKNMLKSIWQIIVAVFVILGGLASLQTLGLLGNLGALITLPFVAIPIYIVTILVVVLIAIFVAASKLKKRDSILVLEDARRLVLLCQTPQATSFLRSNYDAWQRESNVVVLGGLNFDDYMRDLERQGYLEYVDGQWLATRKAIRIIARYHGDAGQ